MTLWPCPSRISWTDLGTESSDALWTFVRRARDVNTPEGRAVYRHFMALDLSPPESPLVALLSYPTLLLGFAVFHRDLPAIGAGAGVLSLLYAISARGRASKPMHPEPRADLVAIALPFLILDSGERERVERLVASSLGRTT